VNKAVEKLRMSAAVRLSRSFWDDARNGTTAEKLDFLFMQLPLMAAWCRISTLELPTCGVRGMDWGNAKLYHDFMGGISMFSRNYELFEEVSALCTRCTDLKNNKPSDMSRRSILNSNYLANVFGPQHGELQTMNECRNQSVKCVMKLHISFL
jgi:hypothetical protein